MKQLITVGTLLFLSLTLAGVVTAGPPLVHDAEYYVLEKQNGERWASENRKLDERLT